MFRDSNSFAQRPGGTARTAAPISAVEQMANAAIAFDKAAHQISTTLLSGIESANARAYMDRGELTPIVLKDQDGTHHPFNIDRESLLALTTLGFTEYTNSNPYPRKSLGHLTVLMRQGGEFANFAINLIGSTPEILLVPPSYEKLLISIALASKAVWKLQEFGRIVGKSPVVLDYIQSNIELRGPLSDLFLGDSTTHGLGALLRDQSAVPAAVGADSVVARVKERVPGAAYTTKWSLDLWKSGRVIATKSAASIWANSKAMGILRTPIGDLFRSR
jgi:hypothetical protein